MSWNPHKSLGVPLQCSVFLTRHKDKMKGCNCANATYLFQQDKILYDVAYDTGDKSVQCGRLNDVFKFWLMWKQRVSVSVCVVGRGGVCMWGWGGEGERAVWEVE